MRTIFSLWLLFSVGYFPVFSQTTKKVLFLGNSYTAVNNLPSLISSVASSLGDNLIYDSNTPGGYTFNGHHTNTTSLAKIYADSWNYVVLQEQSQLPSFPPSQVESDCYPYADSLNKYIQENDSCTRTIFYMTWGRKNGDASNCASYPVICTYEGMQGRLRYSYLEMANNLNAEVSPVGAVWKKFREDFPSVELYQADESHPSIHGSYLAACTFYVSMFHKSCTGAFVPAGITPGDAQNIQNTVNTIVFDSLAIWRIDTTTIDANFTALYTGSFNYEFTPDYAGGDSYFWDFGDGNTAVTTNSSTVNHTFSADGNYTVQLIVSRKCETDTVTLFINVNTTGVEKISENKLLVFPNPANEYIKMILPDNGTLILSDNYGRICLLKNMLNGEQLLSVENLSAGNYFIRIETEHSVRSEKLIILK